MKKSMQILANQLVLNLNDTYIDENSIINYYAKNSTKVIDLISNFCNYTGHIFIIKDNTLWVIDKLQAYEKIEVSKTVSDFDIIKDSFNIIDKDITKSFNATWTKKTPNGNDLIDTTYELSKDTSISPAGNISTVTPYDYIDENIAYELEKKCKLYDDYTDISFSVLATTDIKFLQKLEFKDTYFSGSMIVTDKSIDKDSGILNIKGYGIVNYS
jgi:hypothetical protein